MSQIIGLDVGATHSRVIVKVDDGPVRERRGAGYNLSTDNPVHAACALAQLIAGAMSTHASHEIRCCVGIAGAGRRNQAARFREALATDLGLAPSHILVTTDAEIALAAAFGDEPGALILAGTGSGCHARDESGNMYRTGGWGPSIGDPGSGHALGTRLIRLALQTLEETNPRGPAKRSEKPDNGETFARALAERVGASSELLAVLGAVYAPEFEPSSLAPLTFEWAHRWSCVNDALHAECAALAHQFARLRRLAGNCTDRIVLAGGLTDETVYQNALSEEVLAACPDVSIDLLQARPVDGALYLARNLAEGARLK